MSPALLATGIVAGVVHAVTGPDHLAAVGPIALARKTAAWRTGLVWGIGHAFGIALLGTLAWLARSALPLDRVSAFGERAVGVVLIGIGITALRSALRHRIHIHEHAHDGYRHRHVHVHTRNTPHDAPGAHRHTHTAAGVGALHGFAGTAHLVALLPALALDTRLAAATYVLGYAVGSIAAMTLFAAALDGIVRGAAARGLPALRPVRLLAASAAVVVGVYWLAG